MGPKKADLETIENKSLKAAFFEYSKIPMILIEEDTTISLCNKAFTEMMGITKSDIEGKMSWTELVAVQEELEIMKEYHYLRRKDASKPPDTYEFSLKDTHNVIKNIAIKISMIPGTKQSIATLEDITSQKEAENKTIESEKWYRAIFENTGLPSIIISKDTIIRRANSAWAKLSGYPIAENENIKSWTEYVDPEDLKMMQEYHESRRYDDQHAPRRYKFKFIDRFGNIRHIINSVTMIPGTEFSVASLLDITELVEAENAAKKLEEQLQQTRKLEAIGQLAGGIGHDFNNMLSAIMGYSELAALKARDDSELSEMLSQITAAAKRAGDLTRQLLAYARKQTLEKKVINLNDTIINFQKMLRRTIRENIEIKYNLSPDLQQIEADISNIEQVLLNLTINSQDALPRGGKIIIETANTELDESYAKDHAGVIPGNYAMLSIYDNGTGMDRENLKQIFDPFFTTKEVGKGTGLGLATVYGIVKQHLGNIWVYSEPGKGTTFKVFFPVVDKEIDEKEVPQPVSKIHGTETILLVEDQEEVRKMTNLMLSKMGYTVLVAENGKGATEIFRKNKDSIDLLITDMVMPGISGVDLYKHLKKDKPDLLALFVSGYPRDILSSEGIVAEGINFLSKPIVLDVFASKIRNILDQSAK